MIDFILSSIMKYYKIMIGLTYIRRTTRGVVFKTKWQQPVLSGYVASFPPEALYSSCLSGCYNTLMKQNKPEIFSKLYSIIVKLEFNLQTWAKRIL